MIQIANLYNLTTLKLHKVNRQLIRLSFTGRRGTMLASHAASQLALPACAALGSSPWVAHIKHIVRSYSSEASTVVEVQSVAEYDKIMDQIKESGSLGIIDFTAKWCGPCKAIAPIYQQLSQQYPQVKFMKIDIDNEAVGPVVQEHGITGVPTFTLYKGARKVENFTGARVDLLKSVLQKHSS